MIDRTFGSGTLSNIALEDYNSKSIDDKWYDDMFMNHFKKLYPEDWLLQYLATYSRQQFSKGDILYYRTLCSMIKNGNLYMSIFKLDNFAFPDKQQEDNVNNLKKVLNIDVQRVNNGNSDGVFLIDEKVTLKKVYESDDATPENINEIIELNKISGVCEFGTQDLCKSVMTLKMGDALLRVPYKSSMVETPVAILFKYLN
jgi:hypothetical protein